MIDAPPSLSRIYAYVYRIKGTIPLKDNGFSSFPTQIFAGGKCGARVQEFSWSEWDNMRQIGISFPSFWRKNESVNSDAK